MSKENDDSPSAPSKPWNKTVVICVAVIAVAFGLMWVIKATQPEAQRSNSTRKSAALVETVTVDRATFRPEILALGEVEAIHDVQISPQVGGRITEIAPAFEPGGFVQQGDVLLRIEEADYRHELALRESEWQDARAALAIEEGRKLVAEKEFEMMDAPVAEDNRALVLREPQIESARAQVKAAEAMVEQAKLNLKRTTLRAPFDAHILERSVSPGSQVSPGQSLGQLVGMDAFRVVAAVPARSIPWVAFPAKEQKGSTVTLQPRQAAEEAKRTGRVTGLIGAVDETTRLVRLIITVENPVQQHAAAPPLQIGSILEVKIAGREIDDVVRLDREYMRADNSVWVMADGKLDIRKVEVIFQDATYAYIREGLQDDDEVVITSLATISEGIPLRKENAETPKAQP